MGTKINWSELFPDKWSPIIFSLYIGLFINQGIIITWSQRHGEYDYNIVVVVLMTEILKLVCSTALYCRENSLTSLFQDVLKYKRVMLLYMVPSSLYCLYNNLSFVNLATFDPPTYLLLLQLRVVITGIIFQVIFKKHLSTKQWISLVLLTIGCMIKNLNLETHKDDDVAFVAEKFLNINIILILIQTLCSCLAGVYNEYLLKGEGINVNIFVQNVFMYIDSIVCNVVVLLAQGNFVAAFKSSGPSIFMDPKVVLIMFNNAAIGIVTSFFLKNMNSIVKTFASALEIVFTAVLCWLIFGIPIYLNTALAIGIVCYAVFLYSQNPVQSKVKPYSSSDIEETKEFIAKDQHDSVV